jgi:sensor histidine kinase YesM
MHYFHANIIFLGMLGMMFLFNFIQFFVLREQVYLYYSIYILAWGGFFFLSWYEFYFVKGIYTYHLSFWYVFRRTALPMLSYVFYFAFTNQFLNLEIGFPKLWKLFKITQKVLCVYVIFILFIALFAPQVNHHFWYETLNNLMRFGLITISLIGIFRVIKQKNIIGQYFALGSLLLLIFSLIAIFSTPLWDGKSDFPLWKVPNFYLQIGIILELLCFSLGLSIKHKQTEYQKLTTEQTLNLEREQRYSEQLERTIESQRVGQQFLELRMQALRSQMNPHFLFNSLNAIQECIITNQTDAAVSYLAKFSKLMRVILTNSEKKEIPLSSELETLRLYLDIEGLRFSQSFHYEINLKTNIIPDLINIPPMLIQPYVENAIWHGLLNKQGEGILKIDLSNDDDYLQIIVEDNGLGRSEESKKSLNSNPKHESKGTKLTQERLELAGAAQTEIIDLVDENGKAIGTKVVLKIAI